MPSPFLRAAALALASSLLGCGGGPKEAPPSAPPEVSASSPAAADAAPIDEATTPGADDAADAADAVNPPPYTPFGLPECDSFLLKYQTCVEEKVPADRRSRFEDELRENRTRWWKLADMQQGKVALGLACRMFAQSKKGDLAVDFGCEF